MTCPTGSECMTDGTCCQPQACPAGFTGSFNDGCGQVIACQGGPPPPSPP
jgi:hypothetical protein